MLKKLLLCSIAFQALILTSFDVKSQENNISLNSVMLDSQTGDNLGAMSQQGSTGNIFQAQKQMLYHVMHKLDIDPDTLPPDIRANLDTPQTTSIQALSAFSAGVDAMDNGNFADAKQAFAEAVDIDPSFQTAAKLEAVMPKFNAKDIVPKTQTPSGGEAGNTPKAKKTGNAPTVKDAGKDTKTAEKTDKNTKVAAKTTDTKTPTTGTSKKETSVVGSPAPQDRKENIKPVKSLTEFVSSTSGGMVKMSANAVAGATKDFGDFNNAGNFGAFKNTAKFDLHPQGSADNPMMPTAINSPNPDGVIAPPPLAFDDQGNVIGFINMEGDIVNFNDDQTIFNYFVQGEAENLVEGNIFGGGITNPLFNIKGLAMAFIQYTNAANQIEEDMGPYITKTPVILSRSEGLDGLAVENTDPDNGKLFNYDNNSYYLKFGPNKTLQAYTSNGHQNLALNVQNNFNIQGTRALPRGEFVGMGYVSSSPWLSDNGDYTVEYRGGKAWMVSGVETPPININEIHTNNAVQNYGGVATTVIVKSDTSALSVIGVETATGTFSSQINFGSMKLNAFSTSGLETTNYEVQFSGNNISVDSNGAFYDGGANLSAVIGDRGMPKTADEKVISGSVFGSYAEGIGGVLGAGAKDIGNHVSWEASGAFIGEMSYPSP